MSTYSSASSTTSGSTTTSSSAVHQPEATYHPVTSHAPVTVTGSDGTVHHPGQSVREGVSEIGTTVNHALASVAKGVGNALGMHSDKPAVVVTNNPDAHGSTTAHSSSNGSGHTTTSPCRSRTVQRLLAAAYDKQLTD